MGIQFFIVLILPILFPTVTFSSPVPDPELVVQEVSEKINASSRRNMGSVSCAFDNPIDRCWRCDPDWEKNRTQLADCAIGFAEPIAGGKHGKIYVVTDSGDDALNLTKGTLRYGVLQNEPLWIIFARNMTIRLKQELIVSSNKTIDGRGAVVHITDGPCIKIKDASNIIIHGLHIHHCKPDEGADDQHGDAITIFHGSHVWVDHCSLYKCTDGLIDVVHGSTAITISNNHMTDHDKVMLLGHNDTYEDDKNLHVTIAFNHFGVGLTQRIPRCRFGYFHVVNNDYKGWKKHAIGGSAAPTINSQGNRFHAPDAKKHKEITKREDTPEHEWRKWNWRSDGDILENDAIFTLSGSETPADYANATSLAARPSDLVESMTKGAGALNCIKGQQC